MSKTPLFHIARLAYPLVFDADHVGEASLWREIPGTRVPVFDLSVPTKLPDFVVRTGFKARTAIGLFAWARTDHVSHITRADDHGTTKTFVPGDILSATWEFVADGAWLSLGTDGMSAFTKNRAVQKARAAELLRREPLGKVRIYNFNRLEG